jgi:hypothetical protein
VKATISQSGCCALKYFHAARLQQSAGKLARKQCAAMLLMRLSFVFLAALLSPRPHPPICGRPRCAEPRRFLTCRRLVHRVRGRRDVGRQSVFVSFEFKADSSVVSSFFIDDVTL